MAKNQSATTTTSNSGGSTQTGGGLVGWRDANLSVGGLDFSGIGADSSRSSATSGNIEVGDRIIGGGKSGGLQLGLVKILAIGALIAIVVKIWKGSKK